MSDNVRRRTVLRGIAGGAIGLAAVGPAGAASRSRFVVTAGGPGARSRIEGAGFAVRNALADGEVLLVEGSGSDREELERTDGVRHVARDYRFGLERLPEREAVTEETTDEQFFDRQWDKQVTDVARAHGTATGDGAAVAIIDTGTDVDGHPDLPNVDAGAARLFREGEVRSGTGDVEFPADVGDLCAGTTTITDHVADDVDGHGTHVAGIAAAARNGVGVVGTAPDARVVPLRVFWWDEFEPGEDECEDGDVVAGLATTTGDLLAAIDHAAGLGVDATNMSIGTPPLPPQINATGIRVAFERVIQSATARGSLVVVSAGNAATSLQQGGLFTIPNSTAGAMSVSATGPNDERTFYSNYGTNEVDVGAPGGGYETLEKTLAEEGVVWPFPTNLVLSTVDPDSQYGLANGVSYAYFAGTSMAAPQVTGTAALVREVAPDATPRRVERAIERGADLVRGSGDPELGAGRLNAAGALAADAVRR